MQKKIKFGRRFQVERTNFRVKRDRRAWICGYYRWQTKNTHTHNTVKCKFRTWKYLQANVQTRLANLDHEKNISPFKLESFISTWKHLWKIQKWKKKTLKKKTQEKQTNKQTKPKKNNNNTPYHVWELV